MTRWRRSAVAAITLVVLASIPAQAEDLPLRSAPSPWIEVTSSEVSSGGVTLWYWPVGATVDIQVLDSAAHGGEERWSGSGSVLTYYTWVELGIELELGDRIVASDGTTVKSLDWILLTIDTVDSISDTAYGHTAAGYPGDIWVSYLDDLGGFGESVVRADEQGLWSAYLGDQVDVIQYAAVNGNARITDEDGDVQHDYYFREYSTIFYKPDQRYVGGWGWQAGGVTVSILSPDGSVISSETKSVDAFGSFILSREVPAGQRIQVSQMGGATKELAVFDLTAHLDLEADVISGTALPNSALFIGVGNDGGDGCAWPALADASGSWSSESKCADLLWDTNWSITAYDNDGDYLNHAYRSPKIWVYPDAGYFSTEMWDAAALEVQIFDNVAASGEARWAGSISVDGAGRAVWAAGDSGVTLESGYLIRVKDGSHIKDMPIVDFDITEVRYATDLVLGRVPLGLPWYYISITDEHFCGGAIRPQIGADGSWTADFADVANLTEGDSIYASMRYGAGGLSRIYSRPTIEASLVGNWVSGSGWAGSNVDVSVFESATAGASLWSGSVEVTAPTIDPDAQGLWAISDAGSFSLQLPSDEVTLQTGYLVTASDGLDTKEVLLADVVVDSVDPVTGAMSGHTSPPGVTVLVSGSDVCHVVEVVSDSITGVWTWNPETSRGMSLPLVETAVARAHETGSGDVVGPARFTVSPTGYAAVTEPDGDQTSTGYTPSEPPQPTIRIFGARGYEGDGVLWFRITLDQPSVLPVIVDVNSLDGSAVDGYDYFSLSGHPITFEPGETSKRTHVTLVDDGVVELTEKFRVVLANPQNAVLYARGRATGTILDDDTPPPPSLPPTLNVFPEDGVISGWGWRPGETVLLDIVDDLGNKRLDQYPVVAEDWGDGGFNLPVGWDLGIQLEPGYLVRGSGVAGDKELAIVDLRVTDIDFRTEFVTGIGPTGASISVIDEHACGQFQVSPDPTTGIWEADFAGLANLTEDSFVTATIVDEDGDFLNDNSPPPPYFEVSSSGSWMTTGGISADMATVEVLYQDGNGVIPAFDVTVEPYGGFFVDFLEQYGLQLQSDYLIRVTAGDYVRTLLLVDLGISGVEGETAYGYAPAGAEVEVTQNYCEVLDVEAVDGTWIADFGPDQNGEPLVVEPAGSYTSAFAGALRGVMGAVEAVLEEPSALELEKTAGQEDTYRAVIYDEDGDYVSADWGGGYEEPPTLSVSLSANTLSGGNWPEAWTVDVVVSDAGGEVIRSLEGLGVSRWGGFLLWLSDYDVDLQVGYTLSVTDGIHTKELTVVDLGIDAIDHDLDVVSGHAPTASNVQVDAWDGTGGWGSLNIGPLSSSEWSADFSGSFDFLGAVGVVAYVYDGDRDSNFIHYSPPAFGASLTEDWVIGGSSLRDDLTVVIDAGAGPVVFTVSPGNWGEFRLDRAVAGMDLQPGNIVTVTDRFGTRQLIVTDLRIDDVDYQTGLVTGSAPAESLVYVHDQDWEAYGEAIADVDGHWAASLTDAVGWATGEFIFAEVYDADGDYIQVRYPPSDSTPPTITPSILGTLGEGGWYVGDVSVSWSVEDSESSFTTTGCEPWAVEADTAGTGFDCSATSAGGTAFETVTIRRDATPPVISGVASPGPNLAGWNNSDVAVTFVCSDDTSGLTWCEPGHTLTTEGAGQTVSGNAVDAAGNKAEAIVDEVNIDVTPPAITWTGGPGDGADYLFGSVPAAPTCTASDSLSGLDGPCYVEGYEITVGRHTLTATAQDNAGNRITQTRSYTVQAWPFAGFFQPVDNPPTVNITTAGRAVPVRFSLGGDYGLGIMADGFPISFGVACSTLAPQDVIELTTTAGASGLSYDPAAGHYTYVWKTRDVWAGTCRKLVVMLDDGTRQIAFFRLR